MLIISIFNYGHFCISARCWFCNVSVRNNPNWLYLDKKKSYALSNVGVSIFFCRGLQYFILSLCHMYLIYIHILISSSMQGVPSTRSRCPGQSWTSRKTKVSLDLKHIDYVLGSYSRNWILFWEGIMGKHHYRHDGRSWQPFVEGKNGHENFRQTGIYYFRDKCVVFVRNCKFKNLTQYDIQYIPWYSACTSCPKTLF